MFNVIGKRNWFFLFSGLILVPGIIFILLTPLTNGKAGLQFSIDYTGGTVWQFEFKNPNVSIDEVRKVIQAQPKINKDFSLTQDTLEAVHAQHQAGGPHRASDAAADAAARAGERLGERRHGRERKRLGQCRCECGSQRGSECSGKRGRKCRRRRSVSDAGAECVANARPVGEPERHGHTRLGEERRRAGPYLRPPDPQVRRAR